LTKDATSASLLATRWLTSDSGYLGAITRRPNFPLGGFLPGAPRREHLYDPDATRGSLVITCSAMFANRFFSDWLPEFWMVVSEPSLFYPTIVCD
jgi:hypothetical protein